MLRLAASTTLPTSTSWRSGSRAAASTTRVTGALTEHADHAATQWAVDARSERAILCGICSTELTIDEYLATDSCIRCGAPFNPGCHLHRELYFEVGPV